MRFLVRFFSFQCTIFLAVFSVKSKEENFACCWIRSFQLGPDPKPKVIATSSSLSAPTKVEVTLYGWLVSKHIMMFKKGVYTEIIWISRVSHLICKQTVSLESPQQNFLWVWLCSLYTLLYKCCSTPGVRKMWSEERKLIFIGGSPGSVRLILDLQTWGSQVSWISLSNEPQELKAKICIRYEPQNLPNLSVCELTWKKLEWCLFMWI